MSSFDSRQQGELGLMVADRLTPHDNLIRQLQGAIGGVPRTDLPANWPTRPGVVDYLADATNGVAWRFKYRAGSPSAFKWEFVGGSPLNAFVAAQTVVASGTAATLNTSLTVPLAGEYHLRYGAAIDMATIASGAFMLTFVFKNGGQIDAMQHNVAGGSLIEWPSKEVPFTGANAFAAGDVIALFGSSAGASSSANWSSKQLRITPIRVG